MATARGGCLCGGVRFEVTLPLEHAVHCHCSRCRRHSGSGGLVQASVRRERFRLLQGEELVRVYRSEPDASAKAFCSACGSSLFGARWPEGDEVWIRLGAFDGDPDVPPGLHQWVGAKPLWDQLPEDGLPRFEGPRPRGDLLDER